MDVLVCFKKPCCSPAFKSQIKTMFYTYHRVFRVWACQRIYMGSGQKWANVEFAAIRMLCVIGKIGIPCLNVFDPCPYRVHWIHKQSAGGLRWKKSMAEMETCQTRRAFRPGVPHWHAYTNEKQCKRTAAENLRFTNHISPHQRIDAPKLWYVECRVWER